MVLPGIMEPSVEVDSEWDQDDHGHDDKVQYTYIDVDGGWNGRGPIEFL